MLASKEKMDKDTRQFLNKFLIDLFQKICGMLRDYPKQSLEDVIKQVKLRNYNGEYDIKLVKDHHQLHIMANDIDYYDQVNVNSTGLTFGNKIFKIIQRKSGKE